MILFVFAVAALTDSGYYFCCQYYHCRYSIAFADFYLLILIKIIDLTAKTNQIGFSLALSVVFLALDKKRTIYFCVTQHIVRRTH